MFKIKLKCLNSATSTLKHAITSLRLSAKVDLDSRHMGWVTSELPGGDHHVIKVELKGPENTLRVRQVKVLGWKEGESIKILGQISASMAQQKNCEAETLRVFRLITSQVCTNSSLLISMVHCQTDAFQCFHVCFCRSLVNSSVEMQNQLRNRRRKTFSPLLKAKTRSAGLHLNK